MNAKRKILSACRAMMKKGIRIKGGDWGIWPEAQKWKMSVVECCPMACVLKDTPSISGDPVTDVAELLNRSLSWVHGFISGVDGWVYIPSTTAKEQLSQLRGYEAGQQIAEELNLRQVAEELNLT